MAIKFASKSNGSGSCWTLFEDSQKELGITVEKQTWNPEDAYEALKNGQVVIANVNENSVFTSGGHYIVLTGLTEDGRIIVNDPYKGNYERTDHAIFQDGFKNGFDPNELNAFKTDQFWIYEKKGK